MRVRTAALMALALTALGAGAAYGAYAYNRGQEVRAKAAALTGGDPDRAPELMVKYGCVGCHTIPGIVRANGRVGPPLREMAGRIYVGGVLTNSPDHLVRWIVDPRAVSPKTAMPATGISEREARHVAAYLLTLR